MSEAVSGFIILAVSSLIPFVLGYAIRKRGPKGIVNGVDWERVSNMGGLTQFLSNMAYVLGFIMLAAGVATSLIGKHPEWRNLIGVGIAVAVVGTTLILILGMLRFQDKPSVTRKRDGRR